MALTTSGKNIAADSIAYDSVSLHTADPTDGGSVAEVSGGSPAYARKAITLGAASNGVRSATSQPTFDIPAGTTITHYALWQGLVCVDTGTLPVAETYGGQGTYTLTSLTVTTT